MLTLPVLSSSLSSARILRAAAAFSRAAALCSGVVSGTATLVWPLSPGKSQDSNASEKLMAAATGSEAATIPRPTTTMSTPRATASPGVIVRA